MHFAVDATAIELQKCAPWCPPQTGSVPAALPRGPWECADQVVFGCMDGARLLRMELGANAARGGVVLSPTPRRECFQTSCADNSSKYFPRPFYGIHMSPLS